MKGEVVSEAELKISARQYDTRVKNQYCIQKDFVFRNSVQFFKYNVLCQNTIINLCTFTDMEQ